MAELNDLEEMTLDNVFGEGNLDTDDAEDGLDAHTARDARGMKEGPAFRERRRPPPRSEPYPGFFERRDLPRFDVSQIDANAELQSLSLEQLEAHVARRWRTRTPVERAAKPRSVLRPARAVREGGGAGGKGGSPQGRSGSRAAAPQRFASSWGSFPPLTREERKDWLGYGDSEKDEDTGEQGEGNADFNLASQAPPAAPEPAKAPKKSKLETWLMPAPVLKRKMTEPETSKGVPSLDAGGMSARPGESKFAKMYRAALRKLGPLPWERVEGARSYTDPADESWRELGIDGAAGQQLVEAMQGFGIDGPNVYQAEAVPQVLLGDDVLMTSGTGSGKTLAFLVPVLHKHVLQLDGPSLQRVVDPKTPVHMIPKVESRPRILVVCPSRELASQTHRVVQDLLSPFPYFNSTLLIGGANHLRQDESLKYRQPVVVVGTPGRIVDHAMEGRLVLRDLSAVVLDEIDMLLNVSRKDHLVMLMKKVGPPHKTQRILVSATGGFTEWTETFAEQHMRIPWRHVGPRNALELPPRVLHLVNPAPDVEKKLLFLKRLANSNPMPNGVLVFCNNNERARKVAEQLRYMNIPAEVLSGNRSKESRERAVRNMDLGKIDMLVATDVATRGLDFREMTHVVNFELPGDAATYAHRAGRCGRMGRNGIVISLAGGGEHNVRLSRYAREAGLELFEANVQYGELGVVEAKPSARTGIQRPVRGRRDR